MEPNSEQIRSAVLNRYRKAAQSRDALAGAPGCGCGPGCTSPGTASALGYSEEEIASIPAGATVVDELAALLTEIGFEQVRVEPNPRSGELIRKWMPGHGLEDYLAAARIEGREPEVHGGRSWVA